ncbi:hypothetical protein LCGC14_1130990 [marine sediment metagenome]|uniref:Uncharacterized protein n=1 Tax=marine sediment metagenome TaxID=412755 RepID=A0A0F9Q6Y0_9ZZZZ
MMLGENPLSCDNLEYCTFCKIFPKTVRFRWWLSRRHMRLRAIKKRLFRLVHLECWMVLRDTTPYDPYDSPQRWVCRWCGKKGAGMGFPKKSHIGEPGTTVS